MNANHRMNYLLLDGDYQMKLLKPTLFNILEIHKSLSSSQVTVSHKIQSMAQTDNIEDEKSISRI